MPLDNKKIIITGGNGFIGRHLITELSKTTSADIYNLDIKHQSMIDSAELVKNITIDITNSEQVKRILTEVTPNIVIHLAAAGITNPFLDPLTAIETNVIASLNLIQEALNAGTERVIVAGTSHEFGDRSSTGSTDPISIYAASKAALWAFLRANHRISGWPVVYLRLFQVYGPGQSNTLIPAAIDAAKNGEPLPTTPGGQKRDWIFISDVISAFISALTTDGIIGQSYDVGTGKIASVKTVVERIYGYFGITNSGFGQKAYRPGETWELASQKTRFLPGWSAETPLEEGLLKTIDSTHFEL